MTAVISNSGAQTQRATVANNYFEISAAQVTIVNEASEAPSFTIVSGGATDTVEAGARTPVDIEIDEAAAPIKQGKPIDALNALRQMNRFRFASISPRERFRVVANIGHALAAMGDLKGAADKYIEAQQHQPGNVKALELVLLATHYTEGDQKAYTDACAFIARTSSSATAHAIKIRTAPLSIDLQTLESVIPSELTNNPMILEALYHRSMQNDDAEAGERYARRLLESDTATAAAGSFLGTAILRQISKRRIAALSIALDDSERIRIEECEQILCNAIAALEGTAHKRLLATTLRNHAAALNSFGREKDAGDALEKAHSADPDDPEILAAYAFQLVRSGLGQKARPLLEHFLRIGSHPQVRFMYSSLLLDASSADDWSKGFDSLIDHFDEVTDSDPPHQAEWLHLAISLMSRQKRDGDADKLLAIIQKAGLPQIHRLVLEARIHHVQGSPDDANAALDKAIASIHSATPNDETRSLAMTLASVQRHAEAFSVYSRYVPRDRMTADTRAFLQEGRDAGEDSEVLEICQSLRAAGAADVMIFLFEVDILVEYDDLQSVGALLQKGSERFPEQLEFSINLWNLGQRHDREDWKCKSEDDLPAYTTVFPQIGLAVVEILLGTFGRAQAARYAYGLWRRFPNDHHAIQALITAILYPRTPNNALDIPTSVRIGAAVAFESEDLKQRIVITVEDSGDDSVDGSRMEFAEDHPLVTAMLNKKVGDTFVEPSTFGVGRQRRIVAITSREVHRANELAVQWSRRFPNIPFIRAFTGADPGDGASDLRQIMGNELVDYLQQRGCDTKEVFIQYAETPIPIAVVAKQLGLSVFEAMAIAIGKQHGIWCAAGTIDERQRARNTIDRNAENGVVIELTALATLVFLREESLLEVYPFPIVISQATLRELEQQFATMPDSAPRLGVVAYGDEPSIVGSDAVETAETKARFGTLIDVIRRKSTVTGGGGALASLPKEHRERLRALYPSCVAEAVAIASRSKLVLWTDDLVTAHLAAQMLDVKSFWTMAVLWHLRDTKRINAERTNSGGIRLNLWNYRFVGLWPDMIVQCLKEADWNPYNPIADKLLSIVGASRGATWLRDAQFLASTIRAIWAATERLPAETITKAILEKLRGHPQGVNIARLIHGASDALFGLDIVGARYLKRIVEVWIESTREGGDGPIIIPPGG